jgi:ethanolamine ammonia-lyase large subunit
VDLRQTFVLANTFKEGDRLVGGLDDERVRAEARAAVEALRLGEIVSGAFVDDGVSDTLERALDASSQGEIGGLTVGGLKQTLLGSTGADWLRRHRNGLRSEAIAAVVKVMTADELSRVARAIFNPLPGTGTTVGSPQHFGSRIQPNSPGDNDDDILVSILEGLTYGCGDVIIGLNPASDDVDTIVRLEDLLRSVVERLRLPTRQADAGTGARKSRRRLPEPGRHVHGACRHGRPRRRGYRRLGWRVQRLLFRDGPGIGRDQRRR